MGNKAIVIDDGSQVFDIKNQRNEVIGQFTFVPTDSDFEDRYRRVVETFDDIVSCIESDESEENRQKQTQRMKDEIDYLLKADVASAFFSFTGPFTLLKNGQFFVENVINSISALMEKEMNIRVERVNSRTMKAKSQSKASKYTSKYKKK